MKRIINFFTLLLAISIFNISCDNDDDDDNTSSQALTVKLGVDTVVIYGDTLILDAANNGATYLWSTGETSQTISVDTTGEFWVNVSKDDKTATDTINIALGYELVNITTDFGDILLWPYMQTPLHQANFLKLTKEGFYDSLIFHRVIDEFMIQGGDPMGTGSGGPGYTTPAEFVSSLTHVYGAVGAARLGDSVNPNKESNGSQFYIVDKNAGTGWLNGDYTVFAITVDGMTAVEAISQVATNSSDKPLSNVYMTNVDVVVYTAVQLMSDFGFAIP